MPNSSSGDGSFLRGQIVYIWHKAYWGVKFPLGRGKLVRLIGWPNRLGDGT